MIITNTISVTDLRCFLHPDIHLIFIHVKAVFVFDCISSLLLKASFK